VEGECTTEGKNCRWYLLTVCESGSTPSIRTGNLLSNVWNQGRGAVLAEPFPWTVSQGVILVFVIVNSQLKVLSWLLSTEITTLEPYWVRLQLASIFASVFHDGLFLLAASYHSHHRELFWLQE
jgi:hypothetical protein